MANQQEVQVREKQELEKKQTLVLPKAEKARPRKINVT